MKLNVATKCCKLKWNRVLLLLKWAKFILIIAVFFIAFMGVLNSTMYESIIKGNNLKWEKLIL